MSNVLFDAAIIKSSTEAQDFITNVLESSREFSIIGTDLQWKVLLWNEGARSLYGYEAEEMANASVSILLPPEDIKRHHDLAAALLRDGKWEGALPRQRKDGARFTAHTVVTRRLDAAGTAIGYLLVSTDVLSQAPIFADLLEAAPDAMVIIDADGRVKMANAQTERAFGYARGELMGKPMEALMPPRFRDVYPGHRAEFFTDPQTRPMGPNLELFGLRKDGTEFPCEISLSPLAAYGGTLAIAVIRDITERVAATKLFLALMDVSPDAMIMANAQAEIVSVNAQGERLFGYEHGQLIGKSTEVLIPERLRGPLPDQRREAIDQGVVGEPFEWTAIRKDGSEFPVEVTTGTLMTGDGQLGLSAVRDITLRKQRQELLETNQRLLDTLGQLQQAQSQIVQQERLRAVGQMASGIAHDFNNSLAAILAFTDVLINYPERLEDHAQVMRDIKMIHMAASSAAATVRRLRQFYRPRDAGEVFSDIDVSQVVREAVGVTEPKWKSQALAAGVDVKMDLQLERVPMVLGNADGLRDAIANLVFNAVDALPKGGVITISTRPTGQRVAIEVKDNGQGMSEETRLRCFEPFFSTKGEHGTGLGLAQVYGVVTRHGGTVEIESELGKGTTVRILLPVPVAPVKAPATPALAPIRALRVLVIDDETLAREAMARYLEVMGHKFTAVGSGLEGLQLNASERFDLVLVDRAMPGMSGEAVAAAISKLSPRPTVFMVTGFGDIMASLGEKPAGVDLVLSKPVSLRELREAIATVPLQEAVV